MALRVDPDGHQHGTRADLAAVADVLVAGVQDQVRGLAKGSIPPLLQLGVALPGRPRLTWELVTSRPQSVSVMAATFLVEETPWTYILGHRQLQRARSLLIPSSRAGGVGTRRPGPAGRRRSAPPTGC